MFVLGEYLTKIEDYLVLPVGSKIQYFKTDYVLDYEICWVKVKQSKDPIQDSWKNNAKLEGFASSSKFLFWTSQKRRIIIWDKKVGDHLLTLEDYQNAPIGTEISSLAVEQDSFKKINPNLWEYKRSDKDEPNNMYESNENLARVSMHTLVHGREILTLPPEQNELKKPNLSSYLEIY